MVVIQQNVLTICGKHGKRHAKRLRKSHEHPKDGLRLHSTNFEAVKNHLSELLKDGKTYRLNLSFWRERRSLPQNSLSHMWYEEISEYLVSRGRTFANKKWVKRAMKHSFLGYEDIESMDVVTGEITVTRELRHTSDLDTGDMHHYLSKVEKWAQEIGCLLTIPENSEYRELQRKQEE